MATCPASAGVEVGRRPDAEPPAGARGGAGGGGRGVAQGRGVEPARRSGTDEHEQRGTAARHHERRPGRAVEAGGGERHPVEVGAEVGRQVTVGVHEHGDGIEPDVSSVATAETSTEVFSDGTGL